jgi:hypothetical protein
MGSVVRYESLGCFEDGQSGSLESLKITAPIHYHFSLVNKSALLCLNLETEKSKGTQRKRKPKK